MTNKKHHRARKVFAGSKNSAFYGEGYYLRGEGSNYGRKDAAGNLVFSPYDEQSYLPRNRELAKFIAATYKPRNALVLGCARGYLVQALQELGVETFGIDISEWAIANAPNKIRGNLVVGDICDLSRWETEKFDLVLGFDVFEHITIPDLYTALNEASRVCKDVMFIDVPIEKDDLHPDQSSGTDKSHVSVYSEGFWTKQFTERNFRLDGKDVYTYPEGNQGATLIFRKQKPRIEDYKFDALIIHPEQFNRIEQTSGGLDLSFLPNITLQGEIATKTEAGDISILPTKKPSVAIIMLNMNGLKWTPKAVDTLYRNTTYPFRLVVVDNQSTDGSQDWLQFASKSYPNMTVILNTELDGSFSDGVNTGLRFLTQIKDTSPYVLLLNNDVLFTQKNWLTLMVKVLEKDAANGVVTPKLLYPDGRIQYAGASFTDELQPYHFGRYKNADGYSVEREIPWGTFACALIRRELLADGLDSAYKLGTFEDVDFCVKARFNGYKILYAPQAQVYHYEGATIFTVNKVHWHQQQQANAQLFYSRWRNWLRMNRNAYPEIYAEDT